MYFYIPPNLKTWQEGCSSGLCMMSVHRKNKSKDKQCFVDCIGRDPRRLPHLFLSGDDESC